MACHLESRPPRRYNPFLLRRPGLLFAVSLIALLTTAGVSSAATIRVTTEADEIAVNGVCSLREAIRAANTDTSVGSCNRGSGADTVVVPLGVYDFSPALDGDENAGLLGDLDLTSPITIKGAGALRTVVDAKGLDRVFEVRTPASAQISGITVRGGDTTAWGGGILIGPDTSLTLLSSAVTDNAADLGGGGAVIMGNGRLTVRTSRISENAGGVEGGGISVDGVNGRLAVSDSLISNNTAGAGAGIRNRGTLSAARTLISGNTASAGSGGGISNSSGMTLTDVTVRSNRGSGAGGISSDGGSGESVLLRRVRVVDNLGSGSGGGIFIINSAMTITQSTLSGNSAARGGGIEVNSDATLNLTRSTVSGNTSVNGDGIANFDTTNLTNVTISGNGAAGTGGNGGGLYNWTGTTLSLANVTLAENAASAGAGTGGNIYNLGTVSAKNTIAATPLAGDNCGGSVAVTNLGNNLDWNGGGAQCFTTSGNPMLGALANNGGPTRTHAISAAGAADNAGSGCPSTDQRGAPRGGACDIGAYEIVRCQGGIVNRVGTPGKDRMTGTGAAEVFLLLGGNDRLNAGGGNDRACGGSGNDFLNGGSGRDRCDGGSGRDTSSSCETRRSIP